MKPLISIIVPVYNSEKYLARCLTSLQNQTYSNIEVILIDDGSKDGSASICQSYVEKDKRFRYYYQENSGVSAARNRGLDLACGEYIGFCDSDDWAENDMYEFLLELINAYQSEISVCSYYVEQIDITDSSHGNHYLYEYEPKDAIMEMHKGKIITGHLWNKLCRKSVIGNIRFDSSVSIFEDMLFLWNVFQNSSKIVCQQTKKYHYVQYPQSASHKFRESYWSIINACEAMLRLMAKHYPEHIVEARHTMLRGNILLARKLSEGKCLSKINYRRILSAINAVYSEDAMVWFSQSDRRQLTFFRINRQLFNIYVALAMMRKEK